MGGKKSFHPNRPAQADGKAVRRYALVAYYCISAAKVLSGFKESYVTQLYFTLVIL